jgi:hypothetical protein
MRSRLLIAALLPALLLTALAPAAPQAAAEQLLFNGDFSRPKVVAFPDEFGTDRAGHADHAARLYLRIGTGWPSDPVAIEPGR